MSFQEKSTWVILLTMVLVYGWYFATVMSEVASTAVGDIDYQGTMIVTVIAVVVLVIIGTILITVAGGGDDSSDERDKAINRYGEYVGGFALAIGALAALAMAMIEVEQFWIANTILAGLVLSEIVANVTKIALYRRGAVSW